MKPKIETTVQGLLIKVQMFDNFQFSLFCRFPILQLFSESHFEKAACGGAKMQNQWRLELVVVLIALTWKM